jgi:hypothetical protein
MKCKKIINILVICIIILSFITSAYGIFSKQGEGTHKIQSFRNETIELYGKGLYKQDSISVVAQGKAQDVVTIVIGIPLLIAALGMANKELLKGKLLLTGTLGYFLYTYVSYTFLWMYNSFFLIYVILMSASFFAFTLAITSFDMERLKSAFRKQLPIKFVGGFQIFFAVAIGMMWLGKIMPTVTTGSVPVGLEHYTTLVIQGMDLGFIVPAAFISGVLLLKRKPLGYLLSSVIIMKGFTMGSALTAMIIAQLLAGVKMSFMEIIMFPLFNLVIIYCLFLVLKNIDEKVYN